jgi:MFS family permease
MMLTIFNAGAAGSKNIQTLIVLRFLAGAFGSSPLTNAGGVIADMFSASQRGLATSIFAAAPFLGPVIGPIGMSWTLLTSRCLTLTIRSWWLRWPIHRLALD